MDTIVIATATQFKMGSPDAYVAFILHRDSVLLINDRNPDQVTRTPNRAVMLRIEGIVDNVTGCRPPASRRPGCDANGDLGGRRSPEAKKSVGRSEPDRGGIGPLGSMA